MNERHLQLCASAEWAETVQREILPWALGGRDLGDDVLEVGPGPGMTTDVLRRTVARLTAVEVDAVLAAALAEGGLAARRLGKQRKFAEVLVEPRLERQISVVVALGIVLDLLSDSPALPSCTVSSSIAT